MPKHLIVTLGERQAIEAVVLEHMEDGTSRLGVRVLVPIEAQKYKALFCVVDVTSKQRAELIAALKGEDVRQENGSSETSGKGSSVLGSDAIESDPGASGGIDSEGKKV